MSDAYITTLPPLLMTSAVYPSAGYVSLDCPNERIDYTLESIRNWFARYPNISIVLCDGSGYDFTDLLIVNFPGHKIECLVFKNNADLVRSKGKGYGEGEIVNFALANSKIILNNNSFIKVTSKLWAEKIPSSIIHNPPDFIANVGFYGKPGFLNFGLYVDTRVYFVQKNFYINNLFHAHVNVLDADGRYLERVFADALISHSKAILFFGSYRPFNIFGISGSTSDRYTGFHLHGTCYGFMVNLVRSLLIIFIIIACKSK